MTKVTNRIFASIVFTITVFTIFVVPPVYANDLVDKVVEGLTEAEPGSDKFNQAAKDAEKLTDAQAAEAAQKIVNKITGDAATSVKTLLNLYKLGLKAAPKNPLLKKLGKKLADAINSAMGNLIKVLRDPRTNGGKLQLNKALEDLGISDINKRLDIIDALEKKVKEEEEKKRKKKKTAKSKSDKSLSFDAATSTLSFTDDFVTEIFNHQDSTSDFGDTLVGSEVIIPDFVFNGITPEGEPAFVNGSDTSMIIRKGGDIFLEMLVPYLIWDGNQLFGFGTDIVLSGVLAGSPYDGGLPDLGSIYVDELDSMLLPLDYRFFFEFTITPDQDLVSLTNNFMDSGSTGFSNGFELNQSIPEPSTLLLLLGPGIYMLGFRQKRIVSSIA